MIFLQPLLAASFLGFLFLYRVLEKSPLPHKLFFCAAISPAAGLSLCSLILFLSYFISGAQGKLITAVLYCLLAGALLISLIPSTFDDFRQGKFMQMREYFQKPDLKTLFSRDRLSCLASGLAFVLFLAVFIHFLKLFIASSALNPYGGWDSRFFWNVKASFYFRDAALWKNMFSPILIWTHPDYPLMLSGSVAWGWNWAGKEVYVWPAITALAFMVSLVLLIVWYLLCSAPAWCAWIAAAFFLKVPLYPFWAISQYADVPLCFFFTAAGALLVYAFRTRDAKVFFLAGWMAGMSAWTKNEGLFFILEMAPAALLAFLLMPKSQRQRRDLGHLACGIALPLSAVMLMKIFLGKTGDYAGSSRTLGDYFSLLFQHPENTKVILEAFPAFLFNKGSWNGLWLFFAVASAAAFFQSRSRSQSYGWILAALAVLNLSGYFVILHVTPHDVRWQIQTAFYRLLLHSGVLALLFTFEVFSPEKQKN